MASVSLYRVFVTTLVTMSLWSTSVAKKSKPHIIFIVADDLGWNDVGWHNRYMRTPTINRLARHGVILNSSYVHPTCTPSRSSILTGVYPFRFGLQNGVIRPAEAKHLPTNYPTLPEKLRDAGYATHMIGKWHLGFCNWRYTPTQRGFDSFLGFYTGAQDYYKHTRENGYDFRFNASVYHPPRKQYSTKTYADRAVEVIQENRKSDKPLFMYLSFQSVHTPLQVPKKFQSLYKNVKNKERRIYNGMVTAMDSAIGTVIAALKKYKYLQNSIIVFTTDNGGAAHVAGNNLPLRGSKTTLWEGGTRAVSFVLAKKYQKRKSIIHDGLFHAVDWFPTLLAAAGVKTKGMDIDGMNQWPMLKGKPSRRKEFVYNIDSSSGLTVAAIRYGDYKLIQGSPGKYNDWYRIPKGPAKCTKFKEMDDEEEEDFFKYRGLNKAMKKVKGYFSWMFGRVTGVNWKKYRYKKLQKHCLQEERKSMRKFIFPKYQMFDIRNDPTERINIVTEKISLFVKMKRRLDNYVTQEVEPQSRRKYARSNPEMYSGTWSVGWC
ncbi:arylsulfatase I-like [Pecten maximus]|uniref:arylsulfatase I-like n=1 Tax=Pecten maximus TaxID=6579 RepID=UPI00145881DB|nr:arylsulfatase I-like [Pecten maximus]